MKENNNIKESLVNQNKSKVWIIILSIILLISLIANYVLINEVINESKQIRENAFNYVDNQLDYTQSIIESISYEVVGESLTAVEKETNGKYTGARVNGLKEGKGKYEWNDGTVYEGEFKNDLMDGEGTLTIPNKGTYTGSFSKGLREGKGTFKFANGDTYTGNWLEDKMKGTGTYTFANGDTYTGAFSDNKFNGQGTYKTGGKSYSGNWTNNSYNQ